MDSVSDSSFNSLLESGTPFAVLFTAPWCRYCPAAKASAEQVERENPGLPKIYIADVEKDCAELASRYGIMGVPQAHLFNSPKLSGVLSNDMSPETVKQWLKSGI